jgi:hypothetical protein
MMTLNKTCILLSIALFAGMLQSCDEDDDYRHTWRSGYYDDQRSDRNGQQGTQATPTSSHDYVDMGLSVLWATCNVGAVRSEDAGGYYFWGDPTGTATLADFETFAPEDSLSYIAGTDFDIAHTMWGEQWRLPLPSEWKELVDNSKFAWIKVNGVLGGRFTSTVKGYEGRSLFIPAVGGVENDTLLSRGMIGCYWTDQVNKDDQGFYVDCIFFDNDGPSTEGWSSLYVKLPVRAVFGTIANNGNSGKGNGGNGGSITGGKKRMPQHRAGQSCPSFGKSRR